MTTLAFALPRTFKMAALVLASATLLACDDDATGIDRNQDSDNATGDVQGFVTSSGRGVSGVIVRFISQDGSRSRLTETDANGEFFFRALQVGEYDIELQNGGGASGAITTRSVFVFGGSTLSLGFTLDGNAQDGEEKG